MQEISIYPTKFSYGIVERQEIYLLRLYIEAQLKEYNHHLQK